MKLGWTENLLRGKSVTVRTSFCIRPLQSTFFPALRRSSTPIFCGQSAGNKNCALPTAAEQDGTAPLEAPAVPPLCGSGKPFGQMELYLKEKLRFRGIAQIQFQVAQLAGEQIEYSVRGKEFASDFRLRSGFRCCIRQPEDLRRHMP